MKESENEKGNFSFLKLREEIISKSGMGSNVVDSTHNLVKKLKFEPNFNIPRTNGKQFNLE